jgi:exonuclease SbcD
MVHLLHTADWHLGKKIYGKELKEDHALFFKWLFELIQSKKPHWLLVAGDVFDHANPPAWALEMYYHWMAEFSKLGVKIILTGGNHDSPDVLQAPEPLFKHFHIHVVGSVSSAKGQLIIPLGENLVCAAVPYLRDKDIRTALGEESAEDRISAVQLGMRLFYEKLALQMKADYPNAGHIAMGHLFTQGATTSESERDIQVGNLGWFDAAVLEEHFHYTALGHIHRPQSIGNSEKVRYSGSPIPLSFSEQHTKEIGLISWDGKAIQHTSIPIPTFRDWWRKEGSFEVVKAWAASQTSSAPLTPIAEIRIIEPTGQAALMGEIQDWAQQCREEHPDGLEILQHQVTFLDRTRALHAKNPPPNPEAFQPPALFMQLMERWGLQEEPLKDLQTTFGELWDSFHENPQQP